MDQARRAAGKFELDLNAAADRVLRKVFSAAASIDRDSPAEFMAVLRARC